MLNDIKKTSKHSVIYAFGNTATKIIGLILIPIYTNPQYLSQKDFGALAILESSLTLLVGLLSMAMVPSLSRWYWDKQYQGQQKSIFFSTIVFHLVTIIPVVVVSSLFSNSLSSLLFNSINYSELIKLTIYSSGFLILNNQVLCLVKLKSQSSLYSVIQIGKLVVILGLTLYGILIKGNGLLGIWQARLIGESLTIIVLIPLILKNSEFKIHVGILKEMIRFGMPLMVASISGVFLSVTDRYMLNSMSGLENTGFYSLGFRIANTLKIVITTSLAYSLSPLRMKKMNEEGNQRFYSKVLTYSSFVFTFALLGLSLFSLEAIKIFTGSAEYWISNSIVPIIGYSLLFGLFKDNVTTGLTIKKKTRALGMMIFMTSLLNIVLNLILIPLGDIYGAAFATLLSQVFFFVAVYFKAQKTYPIPYENKKLASLIFVSAIFIVFGLLLTEMNLFPRLLLKFTLFISFPFVLYLFNFYESVELETIKKIFNHWKSPKRMVENITRLMK